jgi:prepilin-type processing-associated H-X9-DG protein
MSDSETPRGRARKGMPAWAWGLIGCLVVGPVLITAIMAAILFPVFSQARTKARAISCLSNTKQQGIAMMMYAVDYDDQLPPAAKWMDVTEEWMDRTDASAYRCPEVKDATAFGYAMNASLAGRKLEKIANPAQEILTFDSSDTGRNAHGKPADLLPSPGRHPLTGGRGNNIAFADGHAKLTAQKQTP